MASLAIVRISTTVKEEVEKEAASDRRTLQATLEILLTEAIRNRHKATDKDS